jgi:hypothetical protein
MAVPRLRLRASGNFTLRRLKSLGLKFAFLVVSAYDSSCKREGAESSLARVAV